MKYIIYILFFVCFGLSVKAQSGFPSQTWAGWIKPVFVVPDSGSVITKRDTNWVPTKPAMTVTWFHAGVDTTQWFWTGVKWNRVSAAQIDTTSLSNRINLKLNISDTASMLSPYLRKIDTLNKWVQNVYARNDSLFKLKNGTETFVHTFPTSGSGTVTSIGVSVPAAMSVTPSTITTSGTFNFSGAGLASQYVKGDFTLGTTDTSMIPNFFSKVRSEFSGTSPITYNSTTGIIGILNANSTGQKGAATFNNSDFTDNGSALISLAPIGSGGSCLNCQLTIDTKGRITSFADGSIFLLSNAPGAGDTLVVSGDTIKRIYASYGLISTPTASSIALRVDTTLIQKLITANNGLTKTGNNIQLGGSLIQATNITSAAGANRIIYSGVSSFGDGAQLDVSTTGSAGIGVRGQAIDGRGIFGVATTGVGVYGTATGTGGYGLFGLSTLGNAIYGRADSGIIWEGEMVPHSNNTIIPARSTTRSSQSFGANGIGYSDDSYLQTSIGGNQLTNRIIYKLTNATDASYTSSFEFWNANNATLARKMAIAGNGQITLDQYTGTNFQTIDTSFNSLVVDGSGNIFKRTGSGSAYTAGNGISISNNVINQLFIPFKPTSPIVGDSYSMGCCPDGAFRPWWDTLSTSFLQGVSVKNLSISGIGVRKGAYQLFNNFDESHANIPIGFFIGFNNTRVLAVDTATHYATIQAAYRSMVAAQFLNHIEAPNWGASGTNANVTYSNGPATASSEDTLLNWQSRLYYFRHNTINTGANWFNKAFCNNDTITIASMIGSNLAFGTFGYYNSVGSRIKINVDGADMVTYDPSNRTYLGQAEGFTPDGIIPDAIMVTGLTNTSHKVKVIFIDNGKRGALDWFGSMCSAQESYDRPAYILSFPHLTDSGYNYSGGQTTQAILDSASATLKRNLLATFPDYAMAFVDINYPIGFYNPKDFGEVSADSIHPSSRGQYNIGKSVYVKMLKNDKLGSYNIRNVFNSNDGIEILSKGSANINISDTAGGNPANYYIAFRSNSISGQPFLSFTDKLASVDNKFWDQFTDGAHFFWRAVNDANTAATIWMQANRSGTTISSVQFPAAPTIHGQNVAVGFNAYTLTSSYPATLSAIGNQPLFTLRNNSSGTDQKLWDFTAGVNVLDFRMGNDAYNNANDWLTVTRTSGFASAQAYFPGEVNFGNQTDQGAYSIQNTGGLYQNGVFVLKGLTPPPSTYNILVHSLTSDSTVYQVPSSTFATGNTLYTGDGTANNRTVTVTGSTMTFTSALTSPTPTLTVNNTSSGHGVLGSASGAGYGIYGSGFRGVYGTGTGGGTGVYGQETSGTGMHSFVTTGTSLQIDHVPTSFNDIQTAVLVNRTTSGNSGNGANGIGTSIQFAAPTTTTTNASVGGALNWYWATATNASRKGAFSLQTVTNAGSLTDKLIVSDDIQLNANSYIFKKIDNTVPYTAVILGPDNSFELGYTPVPTVFNKGSGILIDTNNNASLGATQIPSTAPLYTTGGSTYVSGFQNQAGNFLRVDNITTNITATLTQNFFVIDATSGSITITLPSASAAFAGAIGIDYTFKRIDNTGNTVTISRAGSDLIDGATTTTLTSQYQSKSLRATSTTAWSIY